METQYNRFSGFSRIAEVFPLFPGTKSRNRIDNSSDVTGHTYNNHKKWLLALRQIFPLYIAINAACLFISLLTVMDIQAIGDPRNFAPSFLWQNWKHWDTSWYIGIAQQGYAIKKSTAFFPLYPFLMHGMTFFLHSALFSGLVIANIGMLITFTAFYQLTAEDFGSERAMRAVLYIAVIPTGFFLAAAYNTSLSLSLAILCFYHTRHGNWWLAGAFGFLATLNRSIGILLVIPFLYEYLRQHQFRLRNLRIDIVSITFVPLGIALFGLYCYYRFGDFLAFSHVEIFWGRTLKAPWYGIIRSIHYIRASPGLLSYQSLNNFLNLLPDLFFLVLGILGFVGPWRFPRDQWSYAIYALAFWLFINLVPVSGGFPYPLASMARYFLESFPTFILLAAWGKNRTFHMAYFFICGPIFMYLLMHHLLGLPVI